MPAVIICNFCDTYSVYREYPKSGLTALKTIVTKNVQDEHTKAQLTLLVHVSKMDLEPMRSARHIVDIQSMILKNELTHQVESWKTMILKLYSNNDVKYFYRRFRQNSKSIFFWLQVQNKIDDLIIQTFGQSFATKLFETRNITVSVRFVSTIQPGLRGFSGINEVFINEHMFLQKISQWTTLHGTTDLRDKLIKMDVISVGVHGLSHVRIRQVYYFQHRNRIEILI